MNEKRRRRLASLARTYLDLHPDPIVNLGYATQHLSFALGKVSLPKSELSEHVGDWARGSAAFALAASASASGRDVLEVLQQVDASLEDPGFRGEGVSDERDALTFVFSLLGRATVYAAEDNQERAAEEATLAASMISLALEHRAAA